VLGLLVLVGALAVPAAGAADVLQAANAAELAATVEGDTLRLLESMGRRPVPLPPGSELNSLEALAGGWVAAGTAASARGAELLVFVEEQGVVRRLPAPGDRRGRIRAGPIPFVDRERLLGLAWLEGDERRFLVVRAAAWSGSGWGPAETVSPPKAGSQLALTGTVLPDDTWLLAWSAFDGRDDEILWSRRQGSAWSEPARAAADNPVPDITPALGLAGETAVLAWSRYDGDGYRLALARWAGSGWEEPRTVGPRGSLVPAFTRDADATWLLYETAHPHGWAVAELDATATVRRTATLPTPVRERPAVGPPDPAGATDGVTLRWSRPGASRSLRWLPD
jgi:hypothetical protein